MKHFVSPTKKFDELQDFHEITPTCLSPYVRIQRCRYLFESGGGAGSCVRGIICPPGLNRVN